MANNDPTNPDAITAEDVAAFNRRNAPKAFPRGPSAEDYTAQSNREQAAGPQRSTESYHTPLPPGPSQTLDAALAQHVAAHNARFNRK